MPLCEDSLQIAANPALDRNGNGRLDAIEERGEVNCVPPPNSAGTIASSPVRSVRSRYFHAAGSPSTSRASSTR